METTGSLTQRLWRMRRRRDHIDAFVAPAGSEWSLTFHRNDRAMVAWRYPTRDEACAEADRRRAQLSLAGWTSHW